MHRMEPIYRLDFAGICATILAVGLSAGWAGAILIAAFRGQQIGEQGANLLATLGGAMAGAIATYLGSMIRQAQRLAGREYESERASEGFGETNVGSVKASSPRASREPRAFHTRRAS